MLCISAICIWFCFVTFSLALAVRLSFHPFHSLCVHPFALQQFISFIIFLAWCLWSFILVFSQFKCDWLAKRFEVCLACDFSWFRRSKSVSVYSFVVRYFDWIIFLYSPLDFYDIFFFVHLNLDGNFLLSISVWICRASNRGFCSVDLSHQGMKWNWCVFFYFARLPHIPIFNWFRW